jgi:predicted acyl esterase
VQFQVPADGATFTFPVAEDMELAGPTKLRLYVELVEATDAHLFVAISKAAGPSRNGAGDRELAFEGPFGFGCDVVAKGWLRLAHRRTDESLGEPYRPYYPHDHAEPMRPGDIAPIDIEILPSATFFARGDSLRLRVQGQWFWRRSVLLGMFPGTYAPSPAGKAVLHFGDAHDSHLLVPLCR